MHFLRRRLILGVHVYHEAGVCRKERHLTFRITAIGAVCVKMARQMPDIPNIQPKARMAGLPALLMLFMA